MNTWLFFGLLAPICWGMSNVLGSGVRRQYVKNDYALTWFLSVMRFPFIVVLLILHPIEFTLNTANVMLMLAGILWVAPFIPYYYTLNKEEPSRVALYIQSAQIFTLILGYTWLHERLTVNQWLAFVLLFIGGIFAAFKHAEGKWHFNKIIFLILAACASWALSDVMFRKYALEIGDFWTSFNWYFIGSALVSVFMLPFHKRGGGFLSHFRGLSIRGYVLLFGDQIIGTLGSVVFPVALYLGKVSLTTVLQVIQPLAAFFFGLILSRFIREIDPENTSRSTLILKCISFLLILSGLVALTLQ